MQLKIYKQLFESDMDLKYIESDTLRKCYWDTPYNPDKFELKDGLIVCKQEVTDVSANDLPLLHYMDRNMNEHIVTSIEGMFKNCHKLAHIDCSMWDISSITCARHLFNGCESIESINCSNWNTSKITDMACMFSDCYALKQINIKSWDTSNVVSMYCMFDNCVSLRNIFLPSWNTRKLVNCAYMFNYCKQLLIADLKQWEFNNVTNAKCMFRLCRKLSKIFMNNCIKSDTTDMFYGCKCLDLVK